MKLLLGIVANGLGFLFPPLGILLTVPGPLDLLVLNVIISTPIVLITPNQASSWDCCKRLCFSIPTTHRAHLPLGASSVDRTKHSVRSKVAIVFISSLHGRGPMRIGGLYGGGPGG